LDDLSPYAVADVNVVDLHWRAATRAGHARIAEHVRFGRNESLHVVACDESWLLP
jgi:hypothetical protein